CFPPSTPAGRSRRPGWYRSTPTKRARRTVRRSRKSTLPNGCRLRPTPPPSDRRLTLAHDAGFLDAQQRQLRRRAIDLIGLAAADGERDVRGIELAQPGVVTGPGPAIP